MIISEAEFEAITHGRHAAPHELLGMHQLEDGGVVVRALLPLAKEVVAVAMVDKALTLVGHQKLQVVQELL